MSGQLLLLTVLAVLVFCGLLQRVLDRMKLTDHQALMIIAFMLVGSFIPNIYWGGFGFNIGGGLVPLGVCIYLFIRTDTRREKIRSFVGALLTGVAIGLISFLLPAEAEQLPVDPIWIYGIPGGLLAWVFGRSRRAAFICGTIGIFIADTISAISAALQGYETSLIIGGAGIADAAVISGIIAVLFCEVFGELLERFTRLKTNISE